MSNITVTPGSGAVVAADNVSGVLYQRIKLDGGADGATTPIEVGQAARAASLPVAISTEDIAAIASQATLEAIRILIAAGVDVDVTNQITGFATQPTLAALLSAVQGGVAVSGPQTDAQARANPLPVSLTTIPLASGAASETTLAAIRSAVEAPLEVTGIFFQTTQPVSAATLPLPTGAATQTTLATLATQTTLEAIRVLVQSGVAVTGPLTDTQARATPLPVSGPITDAQIRDTPLPITGTVTATLSGDGIATEITSAAILEALGATLLVDGSAATQPISGTVSISGTVPVSGPQTDAEARATPLPVSLTTIPLATDAATQTTLATLATQTTLEAIRILIAAGIDVEVTNQITGFATQTTLEAARVILAAIQTAIEGTVTVDGAVGISGTVTVNGSAVTQPVSGTFWQTTQPVSGTFWQATQPVSAATLPLPTGSATDATLAGGVGLRPDLDGDEQSGVWALSATPGTVTSITLPNTARIATIYAPSDVRVRLGADPAASGSGAFAAGSPVPAFERRAFLLEPGTSRTLRIISTVASVAVSVEVRP